MPIRHCLSTHQHPLVLYPAFSPTAPLPPSIPMQHLSALHVFSFHLSSNHPSHLSLHFRSKTISYIREVLHALQNGTRMARLCLPNNDPVMDVYLRGHYGVGPSKREEGGGGGNAHAWPRVAVQLTSGQSTARCSDAGQGAAEQGRTGHVLAVEGTAEQGTVEHAVQHGIEGKGAAGHGVVERDVGRWMDGQLFLQCGGDSSSRSSNSGDSSSSISSGGGSGGGSSSNGSGSSSNGSGSISGGSNSRSSSSRRNTGTETSSIQSNAICSCAAAFMLSNPAPTPPHLCSECDVAVAVIHMLNALTTHFLLPPHYCCTFGRGELSGEADWQQLPASTCCCSATGTATAKCCRGTAVHGGTQAGMGRLSAQTWRSRQHGAEHQCNSQGASHAAGRGSGGVQAECHREPKECESTSLTACRGESASSIQLAGESSLQAHKQASSPSRAAKASGEAPSKASTPRQTSKSPQPPFKPSPLRCGLPVSLHSLQLTDYRGDLATLLGTAVRPPSLTCVRGLRELLLLPGEREGLGKEAEGLRHLTKLTR